MEPTPDTPAAPVLTSWLELDGGQRYELKGERVVVGRGHTSTLQIVERTLSKEHAVLLRRDSQWFLQDVGSTNGTMLNDVRLDGGKERALAVGDVIVMGSLRIVYREGVPTAGLPRSASGSGNSTETRAFFMSSDQLRQQFDSLQRANDETAHVLDLPPDLVGGGEPVSSSSVVGGRARIPREAPLQAAGGGQGAVIARLELCSVRAPKSFEVTKRVSTIGSSEDADIVLPGTGISPIHARLQFIGTQRNGRIRIGRVGLGILGGARAAEASTGQGLLIVNGERVHGADVHDSDIIEVGTQRFILRVVAWPAESARGLLRLPKWAYISAATVGLLVVLALVFISAPAEQKEVQATPTVAPPNLDDEVLRYVRNQDYTEALDLLDRHLKSGNLAGIERALRFDQHAQVLLVKKCRDALNLSDVGELARSLDGLDEESIIAKAARPHVDEFRKRLKERIDTETVELEVALRDQQWQRAQSLSTRLRSLPLAHQPAHLDRYDEAAAFGAELDALYRDAGTALARQSVDIGLRAQSLHDKWETARQSNVYLERATDGAMRRVRAVWAHSLVNREIVRPDGTGRTLAEAVASAEMVLKTEGYHPHLREVLQGQLEGLRSVASLFEAAEAAEVEIASGRDAEMIEQHLTRARGALAELERWDRGLSGLIQRGKIRLKVVDRLRIDEIRRLWTSDYRVDVSSSNPGPIFNRLKDAMSRRVRAKQALQLFPSSTRLVTHIAKQPDGVAAGAAVDTARGGGGVLPPGLDPLAELHDQVLEGYRDSATVVSRWLTALCIGAETEVLDVDAWIDLLKKETLDNDAESAAIIEDLHMKSMERPRLIIRP